MAQAVSALWAQPSASWLAVDVLLLLLLSLLLALFEELVVRAYLPVSLVLLLTQSSAVWLAVDVLLLLAMFEELVVRAYLAVSLVYCSRSHQLCGWL
jgi:membrane protease YdiL (CAAX protease family)